MVVLYITFSRVGRWANTSPNYLYIVWSCNTLPLTEMVVGQIYGGVLESTGTQTYRLHWLVDLRANLKIDHILIANTDVLALAV